MTALSLHLPDKLAKASQAAARKLGLSRTEFIRQAILHELQNFHAQQELKEMVESFEAMKTHTDYLKEIETIEKGFNDDLISDEDDNWWKKKK